MATRSLGTLTIDMLLKTAGLEQGATKAERQMSRIQTRAVALGTVIGDAIGKGLNKVGEALYNMTLGIAKDVDQLSKFSQQIGVSTESLSRLQYAAGQMANVSEQQFGMALRRMTRRIEEAKDGAGPAAAALERLGLSARELARMSPDQQFRKLAEAMKDAQSQGGRLRDTMAIFDTEGMPLVNMLAAGSDRIREFEEEADKLGVTVGQDLVADALAFQNELSKLEGVKKGLRQTIASELLPTLTNMTSKFTDAEDAAGRLDKVARVASTGVKLLASVGVIVTGVFKTLGEALGGIAAAVVQLIQGNWREALAINNEGGADLIANVKGMRSDLKGVWDDTKIEGTPVTDAVEVDFEEAEETVATKGKSLIDKAAQIYQQVQNAIERISRDVLTFGMSDEERMLFDIEVMGATPEQLARAERLLGIRRQQLATEKELKEQEEQRARENRVIEQLNLEIEALGKSSQWIARRNALLDACVEAESDMGQAILETVDLLYEQGEAVRAQIEVMDAFRYEMGGALADVISGTKSLKDAFLDMLDSISRRISQIVSDRLIEQLFGQMGTTQTGSSGGWIAAIGSLFGQGKRWGGSAKPWNITPVNEAGIEMATVRGKDYLLTGNAPAQITPNHRLGTGGANVTNNFAFAAPTSPKTQTQIAARVGYELRRSQRFGT